jgi:hypothetical protein
MLLKRLQEKLELVFLKGSRGNGYKGTLLAHDIHSAGLLIYADALDKVKGGSLLGIAIQVKQLSIAHCQKTARTLESSNNVGLGQLREALIVFAHG